VISGSGRSTSFDDSSSCISGYEKVVDAVTPHGCKLFGQLFHPGREVRESQDGSAPVALGPSAVPNERFHVMPRAMPAALIGEGSAAGGQVEVRKSAVTRGVGRGWLLA